MVIPLGVVSKIPCQCILIRVIWSRCGLWSWIVDLRAKTFWVFKWRQQDSVLAKVTVFQYVEIVTPNLKGHCHAIWQLYKKTNDLVFLFKTIWRYWNCFLSPVATDGMDGNGLKLEKNGQFFQVLMLHVPKIFKKFSRFFVGRQKIFTCRLVCGEFRQVCEKIKTCQAISDSARSQNVLSGLVS